MLVNYVSRAVMRSEWEARTVAAHDTRDARLHAAQERVRVQLVLRAVVHVRALLRALVFLLAVVAQVS